ncbi:MAG: hypothetical protein P8Y23_02640, partial [Candidatus Lokiarchaeota archaeon]
WQKYRYNAKKYERLRYEITLFSDASSTSILNIKRTLKDYFKSIGNRKPNTTFDLVEIPKEELGDSN